MTQFADHFSKQSDAYRIARPHYPDALFAWLQSLVPEKKFAWDCATGNGQAAISLAAYFARVEATDASADQIAHAFPHPDVHYRVAIAYASGLENACADIVTVATAVHWFDLPRFYAEADRVLKPSGILAIWAYAGCRIDPDIDHILDHFAEITLLDYWPAGAKLSWQTKYEGLPFPYAEMDTPGFACEENWELDMLRQYLFSWSAVQQYIRMHGANPVDSVAEALAGAWGDPETKRIIRWPLFMKVGRKPAR